MFIFKSIRITGKRCLLCALCLMLVLLLSFDYTGGFSKAATADLCKNAAAREEYINSLGWEIESRSLTEKEIIIPSEFNEVYENYNKLQKEQGFDLSDYRGKKAMLYTYNVTNYPSEPENIVINLIVLDGKVIGGDVCSLELDGFMVAMK